MSERELSRCSSACGRGHRDRVLVGEVQELLILNGDAVQCSGAVIDRTVVAVVAGCAAEELHGSGDDAHRLGGATVFGLPFAPVKVPVDRYGTTLVYVLGDVLARGAVHDDVEEVGFLDPPSRRFTASGVDRQPQFTDAVT